MTARSTQPTVRLRALAARIHGLGPGPLAYLLAELVDDEVAAPGMQAHVDAVQ